jgi:putative ATP-dependent endonuclease of OLD family
VASGQPEGRIQVIVTTHSPNLTAWVSPEHLVVVRSAQEPGAAPPAMATVSIPISGLGLDAPMIRKVSRYLDVTRSALLFGNRALLVEGVAEALLMPVLARKCVLNMDPHALQRFRGAVVVAIDGVDFAPYVHILLRPCAGATIADRVVVVTDADPDSPGNRKADLDTLAAGWGVSDRLRVMTNAVTLEHELFAAGNAILLREVFLALHRESAERWATGVEGPTVADRAAAFVELLKSTRTRKGDFAQQLAERIDAGAAFHVPDYLRQAILAAAR